MRARLQRCCGRSSHRKGTAQYLAVCISLLFAGCATPGAPQPPSLKLPAPITDLRATREGDAVALHWTMPDRTTDRQPIRDTLQVLVCSGTIPSVPAGSEASAAAPKTCSPVSGISAQPGREATYTQRIPAADMTAAPAGAAVYAIEVQNARGRSAGSSNTAWVPLAPAWPPPSAIQARLTAEGVQLTWSAPLNTGGAPAAASRYTVYRHKDVAPAAPAPASATTALSSGIPIAAPQKDEAAEVAITDLPATAVAALDSTIE